MSTVHFVAMHRKASRPITDWLRWFVMCWFVGRLMLNVTLKLDQRCPTESDTEIPVAITSTLSMCHNRIRLSRFDLVASKPRSHSALITLGCSYYAETLNLILGQTRHQYSPVVTASYLSTGATEPYVATAATYGTTRPVYQFVPWTMSI